MTGVLVDELATRIVVVGEDFHFGNQRRGNVDLLRTMGAELGFSVAPVHLVADEWAHVVVSSTRIRALIATGELNEAAALLGRPHEVRGVVVASEDAFEHRMWPSVFIDIPAERFADGTQQIELSSLNVPWSPLPIARARGDVVRVRFG